MIDQFITAVITTDLARASFNSFLLVFAGEMGDKTQILSLMLAARYKKPWTILAGVFIATLLNHALASWLGVTAASYVSADVLRYALAAIFFIFGLWILVPDKVDDIENSSTFGVFTTTVISFFLAEMGDKTQLATIALGATYANTTAVTLGSTIGMVASNALAIFLGPKLLLKIPMKAVRIFACVLFIAFGVLILVKM